MPLTETQKEQVKTHLQIIRQKKSEKPLLAFTIASKQSGSAVFSNDRLLWISFIDQTISYGHIPKDDSFMKGSIPLLKSTFSLSNIMQIQRNKAEMSIRISGQFNGKKYCQWKLNFHDPSVANQAYQLIEQALTPQIHKPSAYFQSPIHKLDEQDSISLKDKGQVETLKQTPMYSSASIAYHPQSTNWHSTQFNLK